MKETVVLLSVGWRYADPAATVIARDSALIDRTVRSIEEEMLKAEDAEEDEDIADDLVEYGAFTEENTLEALEKYGATAEDYAELQREGVVVV